MRKKKLEITKDNYKGYLGYYKLQQKKLPFWKTIIVDLVGLILMLAGTALLIYILLSTSLGLAVIATLLTISVGVASIENKLIKYLKSSESKKLKEEYPYINLNEKELDIEKALEKVNKGKSTKDVKKWENYYGCEEIKKETLSNKNGEYKSYIYEPIKPEISSEEVKQKVKVLTKAKRL